MGRKYIIFRAIASEEHGADARTLAHTGAVTDILAEHFDSSDSPAPTRGYRLREYHQIQHFADQAFPHASTPSRQGDWVVSRTSEYKSEDLSDFEAIIICYCQFVPVKTPLEPLPTVETNQLMRSPVS
ncbi:MAG: hypothetical protein WBG73_14290 [Coleofasciculaceae cyanobacterium]